MKKGCVLCHTQLHGVGPSPGEVFSVEVHSRAHRIIHMHAYVRACTHSNVETCMRTRVHACMHASCTQTTYTANVHMRIYIQLHTRRGTYKQYLCLGRESGASWMPLGTSRNDSQGLLGCLCVASREPPGASWGHLGSLWGFLWSVQEASR